MTERSGGSRSGDDRPARGWPGTARDWPTRDHPARDWPTRDWLAHRAQTAPEATALVEAKDGSEWTYADLDAAVEATAKRLASLGLKAGDHLGVLMETRVAFVRLVYAAMRLGAVLVPLNARLARPELARQADVADLTLLVCEGDTEADAVAISEAPVATVDSPREEGVAALGEGDAAGAAFAPAEWSRDDPQALLFTSGTTGDPKAVTLTMGNFLASATASAFRLGVTPDDRWLLCLSMYHMGGLSVVLRSALYGTAVVLQEGFDAGRAADAIAEYDVTGVSLVPTMLRRMLDAAGDAGLADSLRFVLLGGAPARDELLSRCADLDVPVHPTYGTTETASQIATARPREAAEHRGTVGRPLLWTDVTVVDADPSGEEDTDPNGESGVNPGGESDANPNGEGDANDDGADGMQEPLPAGEVGELVVSGPTVMAGYYGDPDATEAAFGEHGLHTGDVGYRDEAGRLWVLNRREDRIVTGGENVHPGEVVEVLRDHPGVRDAAVVGLDDPEWGERVAALVVPAKGSDLAAADLKRHCEGRLAGFKRPRTVAFADELPRTASGTVEREAVREILRESGSGGSAE